LYGKNLESTWHGETPQYHAQQGAAAQVATNMQEHSLFDNTSELHHIGMRAPLY
jgi:hypothetical protein